MQTLIEVQGESLPALGFGTYAMEGTLCKEAVMHALDIGYRHIDTAQMYNNEEAVGSAVKSSLIDRKEIFVTTKVWPDNFSKSKFVASVENSLRKLQLDYVDLLLLHWPSGERENDVAL